MLIVTVELLPHGKRDGEKILLTTKIWNDGFNVGANLYRYRFIMSDENGVEIGNGSVLHNRKNNVEVLVRKVFNEQSSGGAG